MWFTILMSTTINASTPPVRGNAPTTVTAVHVAQAPPLDARMDAPSWRSAPVVSDFHQWSPNEDGAPSERTEFRVAYDARNLYVIVRAYDAHPDSIVRTVTRRDGTAPADDIGIYIDSNDDHRTGYEFHVNAAGVQRDVAVTADTREDVTWDAVWDAAVRIDSLGWTAEFRIPFSQLRFSPARVHRFGFLVNRVIQRRTEDMSWPAYHPSRNGMVSQFGVLDGLEGIDDGRVAEIAPYVRTQSRGARATAVGADVRVGLASNANVNATVLPDFGQVEADPSVVNLSSVETFYPEHRPFFLDGTGIYNVGFNCTAYLCANEGLFYSRRIGRPPQLSSLYGASSYDAAPILAAAKFTGRTDGGTSLGVLAAGTERVSASDGRTEEPGTTYGMARLVRDARDGMSGMSIVTSIVERSLDIWTDPYLVRSALVEGGTFRHKFGDGQYEVWGAGTASHLAGSRTSIAAVQENDVHEFQRPGFAGSFDTTRTALDGDQEELAVGKYGGAWNWESAFERQSPGYETNDLGYLQRADQQTLSGWLAYRERKPSSWYNTWWANVNPWMQWNSAGAPIERAVNLNAHFIPVNNWSLNAGSTLSGLGSPLCDHCARGGPMVRRDLATSSFVDLVGDNRTRIYPELYVPFTTADAGRSTSITVNPVAYFKVKSRFQGALGVLATHNADNTQWFGNFTDSAATHYSFAHLEQRTRALTLNTSYAATPKLT